MYRDLLKQKLLNCAHTVVSCVVFVTTNYHHFPILTLTIMPLKEANCVLCEVRNYIIKIHSFKRVKEINVDINDLSNSQILTKTSCR